MTVEVHVLASGSDGNCTVICSEGRAVMVDAGLSYKALNKLMNDSGVDQKQIEAILVTHEHADHIKGIGPVARKLDVPIYCNPRTFHAFGDVGKVEHVPIMMGRKFVVAGMDIMALPTSHDAVEPCSYFFTVDDTHVLIATDTGYVTHPVEQALSMADIALVEANYDKRMLDEFPGYPDYLKARIHSDKGHLWNLESANVIKRTMRNNQRQIFLAHLSRKTNTPDVAKDTVSQITGISRQRLDCLEFMGDTRVLKA